jgi:tetratricopeptide (TPR) repeat protein
MKRMVRLSLFVLVATSLGCASKPTATVTISQSITPKQALSPSHMNIAVMNAQMGGDTTEFDQGKWAAMTADMIQYYLENAAEKNKIPLKLIDREHLKLTMGEKDLAAAGVTDSGDQMAASQVKGATAILTSKVTVKIDKQVGKARSIDALSAFGWARGGGGSVSTEEVDEEARNITVQCQFQLKDAGSNDIIVSHNAMPQQEFSKTKASPFFGASKTEADMTPRDKVIGAMVERQAQEFLAKFVPMQIDTTIIVRPSSHEESIAGVRSLVIDEFETGLNHFKQAIAADANDHASLFGAGVCCERLGRFDEARKFYKQAQSIKPKEASYNEAVQRIARMG